MSEETAHDKRHGLVFRSQALEQAVRLHASAGVLDGPNVIQTSHVFEAYLRGDADPMNVAPLPAYRPPAREQKDGKR